MISSFLDELEKNAGAIPKFAHNLQGDPKRVLYSGPLFDRAEISAAIESLVIGNWISSGTMVARFENRFSEATNIGHSVMVNSGSSANLVMIAALKKFYDWKDGDEIIVSVVGFPTTVAPIFQNNLKPVFTDIEYETLNFDLSLVERAITPRTRAIFLSPVLGNPPDMDELIRICEDNSVKLILDGCDSLGSLWGGSELSEYAVATSCSFYPAHHITTGEGGMVSSNEEGIITLARSIAWWGRDCYCVGKANLLAKGTCGNRFDNWLDCADCIIDHKYVFTNIGYNLKPLDLQGAIGIKQLEKMDSIHISRRENKQKVEELFLKHIKGIRSSKQFGKSDPSWFGVPFICEDSKLKERLVLHLEMNNVQTRNYFAGNLLIHPGYKSLGNWEDFPLANRVLGEVFFVGCSPTFTEDSFTHMENVLEEFS